MLNGKPKITILTFRLIKKICYIKISYFSSYSYTKNKVEVDLRLFNYATKYDLKKATGVDTSRFAKNDNLANLK